MKNKTLSTPIAIGALVLIVVVGTSLALLMLKSSSETEDDLSSTVNTTTSNTTVSNTTNQSDTTDTSDDNSNTTNQSDTTDTAEIASWKSYTNQSIGFSFKYPSDLTLTEAGPETDFNDQGVTKYWVQVGKDRTGCNLNGGTCEDRVLIATRITDKALNQQYNAVKLPETSYSVVSVGNLKGRMYLPINYGHDGDVHQYVYVEYKNYEFIITLKAGIFSPEHTFESKQPLFNKILSTYHFN